MIAVKFAGVSDPLSRPADWPVNCIEGVQNLPVGFNALMTNQEFRQYKNDRIASFRTWRDSHSNPAYSEWLKSDIEETVRSRAMRKIDREELVIDLFEFVHLLNIREESGPLGGQQLARFNDLKPIIARIYRLAKQGREQVALANTGQHVDMTQIES